MTESSPTGLLRLIAHPDHDGDCPVLLILELDAALAQRSAPIPPEHCTSVHHIWQGPAEGLMWQPEEGQVCLCRSVRWSERETRRIGYQTLRSPATQTPESSAELRALRQIVPVPLGSSLVAEVIRLQQLVRLGQVETEPKDQP